MTEEAGPDNARDPEGDARRWPHLAAAASIATERDDEEAAALLRESRIGEVHFSEPPLTKEDGQEKVAIEVILLYGGGEVRPEVQERTAVYIQEAVSPEGYRVRRLEVRVPHEG